MANPLDEVTQDRRDDSGNPLRRVYIDTSDAPVAQGTGAGNALTQSMQPAAAEAVPWTIEDLQRGVEAIKQYVAGNVAPVNDMAKRFTNYDRQFTQDVLNAPATVWNNPGGANEVGQRFLGGENWLSNMVRSATTAPGNALASEVPVTSEEMIAPAQDIAGMATGSMLFGRPGAATLGSGPVRPAPMQLPKPKKYFKSPEQIAMEAADLEFGIAPNDINGVFAKLLREDPNFWDKRGKAQQQHLDRVYNDPELNKGYHVYETYDGKEFRDKKAAEDHNKTLAQYMTERGPTPTGGSGGTTLSTDSQPGTAVSALANVVRHTDAEGYTSFIVPKKPGEKLNHPGDDPRVADRDSVARQGEIFIQSPTGEVRKAGYWMDKPEKGWGISQKQWDKMPVEEKLALETKQQATAYKPLKEQFEKREPVDPTSLFSDSQPGTAVSALAQSAKGPAPVFYSALEHAATNAAQETMSPQQWLGFLKNTPGVKAEELAWTGLPEWLGAQKGKVSKKDVQSYLDEHKVEIKDVTKGDQFAPGEMQEAIDRRIESLADNFAETEGRNPTNHEIDEMQRQAREEVMEDPEAFGAERGEKGVRYGTPDFVLPGGENYREHLLTMPRKGIDQLDQQIERVLQKEGTGSPEYKRLTEERARLKQQETSELYRSSHWDEPNVLAHVRTNDRTMARELSPEHVAVNEARAKIQQQIEAVKHEQAAVANEISAVVRPLEKARQNQIRADIKAKRVSGADGLRKLEEYYEHPEIKPLQDKLEQLRAKETELGYSIHDIVPRTMTDEQALAAAKDWVNEGNPNSKKWEQTPKVRQDAWLEQVQKVAGRKAMNEAEKPVKSLHIEEIQSDWHQQGRKQGYKNDDAGKAYDEYMSDLRERIKNDTLTIAKQHGISDDRAQVLASESLRKMQPHEMARFFGEEPQMKALWDAKVAGDKGVPDAPFKTSWPELALKRMIRKAAEEGYDRISWTPGEAQAARYDLSHQVDKVIYAPKSKTLEAFKDGKSVVHHNDVTPEQLPGLIGKDAADKLLNNPTEKTAAYHKIMGDDLKVGGEGMREFYDRMLPKMVEKIGKAHGVKVKTTKLPGEDVKVVKGDDGYFYLEQNGRRTDDGAYMTREGAEKDAAERGGHVVHYFDLPKSLKDHAIGRGFPIYTSSIPFPLIPVDYNPFEKKK